MVELYTRRDFASKVTISIRCMLRGISFMAREKLKHGHRCEMAEMINSESQPQQMDATHEDGADTGALHYRSRVCVPKSVRATSRSVMVRVMAMGSPVLGGIVLVIRPKGLQRQICVDVLRVK